MGRAKKNDWRDVLNVIDLIRLPVTYELVAVLNLSESRLRTRQVYFDIIAHSFGSSSGVFPRSLFDAVCDSPDEAEAMDYEVNAARTLNELRNGRG